MWSGSVHPASSWSAHDDEFVYIPAIRVRRSLGISDRVLARRVLRPLATLRAEDASAAFSVCPPSQQAMDINRAIWRTVRRGYLDAEKDAHLFPKATVFMLRLPAELQQFLLAVTEQEIQQVVVDFLVLLRFQLAEDDENHGLEKLKREICPQIWQASVDAEHGTCDGEPIDQRRRTVLEELVSISYMTPWQIDVDTLQLTTSDVNALLCGDHNTPMALINADENTPLLHLAREWTRYEFLLDTTSHCPVTLFSAILSLVQRDQQAAVLDVCTTMMCMSRRPDCLFSLIPGDVLESAILPRLVLDGPSKIPDTEPAFSSRANRQQSSRHPVACTKTKS